MKLSTVWCFTVVQILSIIKFVLSGYQIADITDISEVRGYFKREHSLIKPFQGLNIPYWDYVGSTMIASDFIRLTRNEKSLHGGLWNINPVYSRDWELVITVKVHGSTGELYGDGMAFWYVRDRDLYGNETEVFGYKDKFYGLGIFLDTYSNHNGPHNHAHPFVSAMVNNGDLHYDHDLDGTHTQLGSRGCTAKLRNKDYETNILIRYVDDTISVYTDIDNKHYWRECFLVEGVRLPTGYHFGLSAATGDLSDNHDIIGFKMYEIDVIRAEKEKDVDRNKIQPEAKFFAAPRDHVPDPPPSRLSGLGTTIMVIFALVAVAGILIVGVIVLQRRQEVSRKRFY